MADLAGLVSGHLLELLRGDVGLGDVRAVAFGLNVESCVWTKLGLQVQKKDPHPEKSGWVHDVALLAYHLADVAQDPDALGNPLIKMVWTSPLNSTSPAEEGSGLVGIVPSSTSTLILFCGASS